MTKISKILILNAYLPTLGGGEKHMGYLCQFLERYYDYKVDIDILVFNYENENVFSPDYVTIEKLERQFKLDLKKTKIRKLDINVPKTVRESSKNRRTVENITKEYDLFIDFMFMSKHIGKAKVNLYECMFPTTKLFPEMYPGKIGIYLEKFHDLRFIRSYDKIITNSEYTDYWADYLWETKDKQVVIYPPVFALKDIEGKYKEEEKKNIIISVGRFFVASHSKRQLDLVKFFVNHQEVFANYEYHLVGAVSSSEQDIEYLNEIKKVAATVDNVFVHENYPYNKLMDLYSHAKIFWHATGYGIDETKQPEKMEHFGITTVEAMSNGVVPVVIRKGGQKETVVDGETGYTWLTEEECVEKTKQLIEDDSLRRKMAAASAERAKDYSIEKFYERNEQLFHELQI